MRPLEIGSVNGMNLRFLEMNAESTRLFEAVDRQGRVLVTGPDGYGVVVSTQREGRERGANEQSKLSWDSPWRTRVTMSGPGPAISARVEWKRKRWE